MDNIWNVLFWMGLFEFYKVGFSPEEVSQIVDEMEMGNYIMDFVKKNMMPYFDEELLLAMPSRSKYLN